MQATLRRQIVNERGWVDQGDVPTFVNSTTFTVPGDQTLTYTVNSRVWITDGTTNCYGTVASSAYASPNTTVALTLDNPAVGVPTAPTLLFAGILPNAAMLQVINPVSGTVFDENPIINGAMVVAQRGTSFPAAASATCFCDRSRYLKSGSLTAVVTVYQAGITPGLLGGVPYNYGAAIQVTTAQAAMAAGDYAFYQYVIEGYDWAPLAQRQFTISFWAYFGLAGTYAIGLRNSTGDRSCVQTFTITTANVWQKVAVTFPASPTAGTWNYTNGYGLQIAITYACGSTYATSTFGVWQTANVFGATGQTNGLGSAVIHVITGLRVDPGPVAAPFRYRTFADELQRCRRYYWKSFPYATAPAQNAGFTGVLGYSVTNAGVSTKLVEATYGVVMRAGPTFTFYNPAAANANWRNSILNADSGAASVGTGSERSLIIANPQVAGDAVGHFLYVHATADAEL